MIYIFYLIRKIMFVIYAFIIKLRIYVCFVFQIIHLIILNRNNWNLGLVNYFLKILFNNKKICEDKMSKKIKCSWCKETKPKNEFSEYYKESICLNCLKQWKNDCEDRG